MKFQAALFDMDGVLVDSGAAHLRSWQDLAREINAPPFPEVLFRRTFGKHGDEIVREWWGRELPPDEVRRLLERKERAYREVAPQVVRPIPGVVEFVESLQAHGLKIGIASSGPRENVELVIELLRLGPYLSGFAHGNEVRAAKPAPDVFLKAAERVGVPPEKCVVFEDSLSGVEAGLAAGMTVVAVSTTRTKAELLAAGATCVWTDFDSATWETFGKALREP